MLQRFRPRWSYWLLVCLFAVIATLATSPVVAATGTSWRGRQTFVQNYGSFARVDRPASNATPGASYLLVIPYVVVGNGQWFMQSGMGKTNYPNCPVGQDFHAFAEYIGKNTGGYVGLCFPNVTISGQNSAYQETNSQTNPYWCAGLNGQNCLLSVSETTLGMTNATNVAAYGETSQTEAN